MRKNYVDTNTKSMFTPLPYINEVDENIDQKFEIDKVIDNPFRKIYNESTNYNPLRKINEESICN